ncbi:hypothetical protein Hanom_Chr05g00421991 [Helianthus anomalus]
MSAFGSQNTVIIVGMNGRYIHHQYLKKVGISTCSISIYLILCEIISFYRCAFDPVNGGEMIQHEYVRFLKTELKSG